MLGLFINVFNFNEHGVFDYVCERINVAYCSVQDLNMIYKRSK